MTIFDAVVLGAVQGLAEFLPISSSGHLVLAEYFLKLDVASLKSFDIALHFGSLLALLVYFWKDIWLMIKAFFLWIGGLFGAKKEHSAEIMHAQKMVGYLILATIPAIVLALTLGDWLDEQFRHPVSVAILILSVAILFFVAEYIYKKVAKGEIKLRQAVVMGLAQCLALIPGVSRSGITISAGMVQGVKREEAARFSFLLGSIAIFGATVFAVVAILKHKYALPATDVLVTGILSSFVVGLGSISFLMNYLKKHTLNIFAYYRIILAVVILVVLR